MSAIIINPGHSHAEVAELLAGLNGEGRVEVASFNSKTQIVLAGCREGILRASEALRERDIAVRVADLPVSYVPSHPFSSLFC
jgi:malonyl CoA-acyl carrier protein transacylase